MTDRPHRAFVGLGANLGDPVATLSSAVQALQRAPGVNVVRVSSLYRSAPVDAEGPPFVNACVQVETSLDPHALLEVLQRIEREHGRARPYRNAPRTLDLDLLAFDELVLDTPTLVLPHPRLHQRAFVLRPLAEIAPDLRLPGLDGLASWLDQTSTQAIQRIEAA